MTKDVAVREAAQALRAAIGEAEAAGYRVAWPSTAGGLGSIAVSETARVAELAAADEAKLRQLAELPATDPQPVAELQPAPEIADQAAAGRRRGR